MGQDRFAETRARRALQGIGLDNPPSLIRAASTRNEVHVAPHQVVRINQRPDQRLRREGLLCRELPETSYFPKILGYSGETGFDFVVVERKPGVAVSRAWPMMDIRKRRAFIREFSTALRKLHSVPTPSVATKIDENPHLLDPSAVSPVVPILMACDELMARRQVDRTVLLDITDMVNDHGDALEDYHQRTLIHGDLSLENVMTDSMGLSAILDFEWSRGAPADLELDVLLRFLRFPEAHLPADVADSLSSLDFVDVPSWMAEDYPELFSHPRLVERLALYNVAFTMAELVRMDHVGSPSDMGPMHPVKRLQAFLNGVSPLRDQLKTLALRV